MVSSSLSATPTAGPSLRAPVPKRAPSSQSQTPGAAHGLRGHLKQLLPRHALFGVHVVIHDLSSVPLVHGDFGVRWRFKNVQSAPGGGGGGGGSHRLLDRMRGGSRSAVPSPAASSTNVSTTKGPSSIWKGKGRAIETPDEFGTRLGADGILINIVDTTSDQGSSHAHSIYRHDEEDEEDDHSPYFAPGTAASISTHSLHAHHLPTHPGEVSDEGRGSTSYIPLRDHAVKWEQTVDVVVQMNVSRDTNDLLQNELKLVVQQLAVPGDPDAPANPLLGSVSLNLAEYADKGPVTRKYLLQHSKTNALLKLTIQCTHVGGFDAYIAPPLHKGEVMTGITGLLAHAAPFVPTLFSAAAPLPLGRPIAPALADNPLSSVSTSTTSLSGSTSSSSPSRSDLHPWSLPPAPYTPSRGVPFSLAAAAGPASASGPLATRDLIEALFNPVPSTSTQPSPFTYFDPAAAAEAEAARATAQAERAGADADGASEHASEESSQPSPNNGRTRHWWKARRQKTLPVPAATPAPPLRPPSRAATGSFRVGAPLPMGGGITMNMGRA